MSKPAQLELFRGASQIDAPSFRDDRDIMALPFLSISKTPRHEPIEHHFEQDGRKLYLKVTAGSEGIATIYDYDILQYLQTMIIGALNRGEGTSNRIQFTVGDCLKSIRRHTGKTDYDAFLAALKRLKTTTIFTNITTADTIEDQGFGWVQQYKFIRRRASTGQEIMTACEVVLSDWLYNLIVTSGRSLAVDPRYFEITGGLERKLYLIARRHVGSQAIPWTINLANLYAKVGAQMPLRRFKFELARLAEADTLPDYSMDLTQELQLIAGKMKKRRDVKVVFRKRS